MAGRSRLPIQASKITKNVIRSLGTLDETTGWAGFAALLSGRELRWPVDHVSRYRRRKMAPPRFIVEFTALDHTCGEIGLEGPMLDV
ncbi:hypothetical protein Zmor_021432 [Zophobas morio]|uniref:Uncharacterized protein n=1 Tax=Zophobas morio TaxID=2755281 RepID=A0AA38I8K6_9CUCU|nr:hypothetical protein Zmor_021432 [Zophobas morio]